MKGALLNLLAFVFFARNRDRDQSKRERERERKRERVCVLIRQREEERQGGRERERAGQTWPEYVLRNKHCFFSSVAAPRSWH